MHLVLINKEAELLIIQVNVMLALKMTRWNSLGAREISSTAPGLCKRQLKIPMSITSLLGIVFHRNQDIFQSHTTSETISHRMKQIPSGTHWVFPLQVSPPWHQTAETG
jgi:hypothetical protein